MKNNPRYIDFVLDYNTMCVSFYESNSIINKTDYTLENTVVNKIDKTFYWRAWSYGDKGKKWSPRLTNYEKRWSVPLLKSNLQKAVRQMKEDHAISSVLELAILDCNVLLRRLPIIAIEDVTLIKGTSVVIWMMMQKKDYLYEKELKYILKYTLTLCKIKETFASTISVSSLPKFDSIMNIMQENNNSELGALYIRSVYGGMKGDIMMLYQAIDYYSRTNIEHIIDLDREVNIPEDVDFNHPILDSAIDFHPCPWIKYYISKRTKLSQETIVNLIWNGESALNLRKPLTISVSKTTKDSDEWLIMLFYLVNARKLASRKIS